MKRAKAKGKRGTRRGNKILRSALAKAVSQRQQRDQMTALTDYIEALVRLLCTPDQRESEPDALTELRSLRQKLVWERREALSEVLSR